MKTLLGAALSMALALPALGEEDPAARGCAWLMKQQQGDGSFAVNPKLSGDVGITALAVAALARAGHARAPEVEKAVAFLLKHRHEDGSFWNDEQLYNYRTAVALMALHAVDPMKYAKEIKAAQDFVAGIQVSEATGAKKEDPNFGGIGYGSDPKRNDMSNTQVALQALKESGYSNDEVFKRAAEFAAKCQNLQEANPLAKDPDAKVEVGDDGSFVYSPMTDEGATRGATEPAGEGKVAMRGYGSMTYAGLLTMVYARLTKEDPRVGAAWGWIRKHYTLEDNPGLATPQKPGAGKQGLYYYYLTFAKAMRAFGESQVETPDGAKHRWARELLDTVLKAQKPEGYWENELSERWMEGNPVLATSYALEVIRICREDLGAGK